MITQGKETFQSPKALNPTTSVSDDSNEGEPVSPSLIAIGALDTFTNRKATTNESFTTFEDVSARSLNKEESGKYMIEDEKVILQEHVRNQRVFSKIAKEYQENQKHKKKRKKLQISVEYKKFPVQNTQRFSLIGNNEDELEESIHRLSLTCKNPINIIEDLNFEPVPFTPVVPASEEHIVNLELKQKLLLLESRNTQLEGSMESLKKEVKKANTKVEMLEFENMELAKQLEEFFSIPKVDVGTDPLEIFKEILKADQIIQMDPPTSTSVQIQTESTCWQQLIEKMKEELAAQAATLSSYEKSKAAMTLIIEKQQKTLDQYESEKMQSTKQKKTLISEITTLKTELERHRKYTLEVKELRQKVAQLQEENNQLQSLPAKLEHYENLSLEAGEKLREASLKLEEAKQESHKRAHKIKEVRKERDLLKIELLKLKQMFSEKYESYKEVKGRLYKKVKQKDETIDKLQKLLQGLDQIRNHSWKFEIEEDIQNERKRVSEEGRSKSFYSDETNPAYNSRHGISNNTNDSIVENDVVKKGPVDKYEYDQVKKSLQRGKYNNVSKMKNTSSINSDVSLFLKDQYCRTKTNHVLLQKPTILYFSKDLLNALFPSQNVFSYLPQLTLSSTHCSVKANRKT
eukprot:TRINITY_DN159_c0_g1_i1.p4 TRINITY_DN159_c0_g1~~TRINITY_DN159_c0_g1_i1.p4  ORF type:complete len:632 (+),score=99.69 TRINITY_DN159_c0_g1_i1:110-2005(+)